MRAAIPQTQGRISSARTINYVIVSLLLVFAVGPILILIFNSLKSPSDLGRNPLGPPTSPLWANYPNAWTIGNFAVTLPNTLVLVVGTMVGVLLLGGMAAYSFSKPDMPGASLLTMYFLVISSLPVQMFLVPLFYMWRTVGLVNTLYGLILIYIAINSPFAIFLLRSFIVQIPRDFADAAQVDGANEWAVFTNIVIPLAWPAFLTVGLVVALSVWNEFLLATVFLTDQSHFTVVTSYYNFTSQYSRDWGMTSAAAVMMILPILVLFMLMQRRFIEGLTQGGLKG